MLVSLLNRTSGEVIKRKPRLVVCIPCACVMPWSICCVKCVCLWLFCLYRVLGLCIWFIASTPGLHVGVYVRVYQVLACWCVCVCRFLSKNCTAVIQVEVARPVCLECYQDCKELGRITLREGGNTIAAGLVTKVKSTSFVVPHNSKSIPNAPPPPPPPPSPFCFHSFRYTNSHLL